MSNIKILALIRKGSGSKYHRVFVPLELLPKDKYTVHYAELDYLPEELVSKYDVIYIHWLQKTKCEYLSIWKEMYGFKIILDIDDYWIVPSTHYLREKMKGNIPQLENQMIVADVILCATEFLVEKCKVYNKNVVLRKNYIPIDRLQFKKETKMIGPSDKIRVGICGSISHEYDWLSIKGQLEKIKNDKEIQDNVQFIICGYADVNPSSKKKWDKFVDMFTYKRDGQIIKPLIIKSLDPTTYIVHYKFIDVVLAPLLVNDFNRAKSELKLFEAACKSGIVISNELYREKGYTDYLMVDKDNSYYSQIKKLLNREYLNSTKIEFQKNLLDICEDFEKKYDLQDILNSL